MTPKNSDVVARILAGGPIPPEWASTVTTLDLSGTPVTDLTPLAGLAGLQIYR